MSLQHCIIHHINRTELAGPYHSTLKPKETSTTGAIASLFEQARSSFKRSSQKRYGHFDADKGDAPLAGWLRDFQQKKSSFLRLSQQLTELLALRLDPYEEPLNIHILFAIEERFEQPYFYVFWLEHCEAHYIDHHNEVDLARYIDSAKVHHALCVSLEEWLSLGSQKYLSLLSSRGDKTLTEAFVDFTCFKEGLDLEKDTQEFLSIVDQYSEHLGEEKDSDQIHAVRRKIIDYCIDHDRIGEPVNIENLSESLDSNESQHFSAFVQEHQPQPRTEIHTHRPSLKRYVRFFGRDDQMSISFASDLYGKDIEYDAAAGTLLIKKIPKSLRAQLQAVNLDQLGKGKNTSTDVEPSQIGSTKVSPNKIEPTRNETGTTKIGTSDELEYSNN